MLIAQREIHPSRARWALLSSSELGSSDRADPARVLRNANAAEPELEAPRLDSPPRPDRVIKDPAAALARTGVVCDRMHARDTGFSRSPRPGKQWFTKPDSFRNPAERFTPSPAVLKGEMAELREQRAMRCWHGPLSVLRPSRSAEERRLNQMSSGPVSLRVSPSPRWIDFSRSRLTF